jgi:DNA-3-methyladenine glycosylase
MFACDSRLLQEWFQDLYVEKFCPAKWEPSVIERTMKLSRRFYKREDTIRVAKDLLGKLLVVPAPDGRRVSGMIVETEAYLGEIDKAAHSFGGRRTLRNEITYAEGGHAYVFFIYGMYFQLNVVAGLEGSPHVVLVRALEPVEGVEIMRERRGAMADKNLTSGPGKLCIAMGIDRSFNGEDLVGDRIWIEKYRNIPEPAIASGPRVGIDYAEEFVDMPWRFWVEGSPFVSKIRRRI